MEEMDLEAHMQSGNHIYPKEVTAMDKVKKSFINGMMSSSHLHLPTSTENMIFADIDFNTACEQYPVTVFSGV